MLSVVHDLAEAIAGDIAPWEAGITKEDKIERERVSIRWVFVFILNNCQYIGSDEKYDYRHVARQPRRTTHPGAVGSMFLCDEMLL